MKYYVVVEDIARDDIVRNAQWWSEHHSNEQAVLWYEMAVETLDSLELNPERHALSPENGSFDFEIRELLFGHGARPSYRAVFTIRGNTVHVLTVRRASQDVLGPDDIGFEETK